MSALPQDPAHPHPHPDLAENFRSPAALARFFLTTILGVALDLWTKSYAFATLKAGTDHEVNRFIRGWLHFEVTVNHGAVFGIGQGQRWLFISISIAAIGFLTYLFATSGRQRFYQFVLGLLLAGVLGNMYDRLRFGYVRDMIHALPHWPRLFPWIFNVADVLLCTGVGLMVVNFLFARRPGPATISSPSADERHLRVWS